MRIFWQQPSRYYERELQQGQQPSWSKWKRIEDEGADILADKAISDPKLGKEWCQRTNRAVFTWRKPCREAGKVTYQDRHSTFNYSGRDAIRRGAAENEVPKHEEKLTGVWRQMSTLRRRYEKRCKGDDIEDCTRKQRYEESYQSMVKVLQQNIWIDDRKFLKSCVQTRAEQGNINHLAYGTWNVDFMFGGQMAWYLTSIIEHYTS